MIRSNFSRFTCLVLLSLAGTCTLLSQTPPAGNDTKAQEIVAKAIQNLGGARTVQVNTGNTGWIFDGEQDIIKIKSAVQVENFKRGLRTSLN